MAKGNSVIAHPLPASDVIARRKNIVLRNMQLHSRLDAARKHPQTLEQIAKRLPVYSN